MMRRRVCGSPAIAWCSATVAAWSRLPAATWRDECSRSSPAQAANSTPPMVPVAVSMIPAAAAPTTPCGPRMSTAAPAPAVGPMGSWPSMTTAMRTAMASNTEASMPTACSMSQLRAICATTATRTKPTSRVRP